MNSLAQESSAYLQQHALNPIHWQAWSKEVLEKSRRENKPIFLSSGYSSCHWCHVMEKESFSDPRVAEILNENFIPIKLDREERPDVDSLYMKAVQIMTGQGGWPLNVFLTPELRPFFGGTYFPPVARYDRPAFSELLLNLVTAYRDRPQEVRQNADQLSHLLFQNTRYFEAGDLEESAFFDRVLKNIKAQVDAQFGGIGEAPKFFHTEAFRFLLRQPDPESEAMVKVFLDQIAMGAIQDHVAGGFHRYSTDRQWKTPHYEKMLTDNALLAELFVEAYDKWKRPQDRFFAERVLDWCRREMKTEAQLFAVSLDADLDGKEGAFYLWSVKEIEEALKGHPDFDFAQEFLICEGSLRLKKMPVNEEDRARYLQCMAALHRVRDRQKRPAQDSKIIVSANALLITALAKASAAFDREDYRQEAVESAHRLWEQAYRSESLAHVVYPEGPYPSSFLEDYASMGLALLRVAQLTQDEIWTQRSSLLAKEMRDRFYDEEGGAFWFSPKDQKDLLFSSKEVVDSALPSPVSLALRFLSEVSEQVSSLNFKKELDASLKALGGTAMKSPGGFQSLAVFLWDRSKNQT